ncbi:NADH-quinone oxidoreductase subunit NuoE [Acetomicrobium hydrogeniformans]|jgi:NADH-quinone oxidoreductase subunit E|uniref:Putative NDH-1 subunit E n=1 Tax=Acetomicrobium hydrogeniformans ATCC BAA-1850 TaxID=592015 RepID=A0A0T5XAE1_9BACT|nr:putative NDH-1 subunit E [Acetomicrobium hydrogeniformans ATCC BAA-1850]
MLLVKHITITKEGKEVRCVTKGTKEVELDIKELEDIVNKAKEENLGLIPLLQRTQEVIGYLPKEALVALSEMLHIPYSKVFGVATFYAQFHLTPRGRHVIQQCDGTACHVKGGPRIRRVIEEKLGISPGETTEDLKATYEIVYCLGSCGLAPAAMIDGKVIGRLTQEKMKRILDSME